MIIRGEIFITLKHKRTCLCNSFFPSYDMSLNILLTAMVFSNTANLSANIIQWLSSLSLQEVLFPHCWVGIASAIETK